MVPATSLNFSGVERGGQRLCAEGGVFEHEHV